jgi:hypothetical protein
MISLKELAMPMIGRSNSQSVKPSALSRERCGALSGPLVIRSLLLLIFPVPLFDLNFARVGGFHMQSFKGETIMFCASPLITQQTEASGSPIG